MNIALDYDGTYTKDPSFWDKFIALEGNHNIICVTMRHNNDEEKISMPIDIIYTGRKAKMGFLRNLGISIDIWIDDNPEWIFSNG